MTLTEAQSMPDIWCLECGSPATGDGWNPNCHICGRDFDENENYDCDGGVHTCMDCLSGDGE